jgi:hypothetical protein
MLSAAIILNQSNLILSNVALEIMDERGETGPIAPVHLREAFRRYQKRTGTIQNKLYSNHLFG